MHRPRRSVPILSVATAIVLGPMLAGISLAADPITVRPGDTLTGISRRHGVSIDEIVRFNDLADPNRIYVGQRLRLEGDDPPAPAAAPKPSSRSNAAPAERSHTVRAGEHLTGIARRYGVTIAAIVTANGISNPSRIYVGQRLVIPGTKPAKQATAPTLPQSMRDLMARRDDVRRVVLEEAKRFDVPAALALAVAWQESGWRQNVVSSAGAVGVMQLLPATGEWVAQAMLGRPVDVRSTRDNVRAGVRLLRHYLDRYDGNVDLVLAAYYQGQRAADRHGVYPVTRPYIASIKVLVKLLGG